MTQSANPLIQTVGSQGTPGPASFGQQATTLVNGLNSNIATGGQYTLRFSGPTGAFSIGGFSGANTPGAVLQVVNTTTQTMTIVHEDASSTSTNRIDTQSGVAVALQVGRKQSATFVYDGTTSRWVLQNIGYTTQRWVNVKDFGAVGDGSHDDTSAIQAAINVFSGHTNTASGEILFPPGIYKITSSLTYIGNVTGSIRLVGAKAGFQSSGTTGSAEIAWAGPGSTTSALTMMHCYGANQCEWDNLIFNCNLGNVQANPGSVCVWLHYDATNSSGCSNCFFRDCQFLFMEGPSGGGGYQDSMGVAMGDNGANTEVNGIYFDYCTFTGNATSYPNHIPFASVCSLQQGVGNTEIFHFRGCQFQYGQFAYYCLGGNNPVSFTDGCQFEGFAQACIWTDQTALVYCDGCDVEINNDFSPSFTKQGIFVRGGTLTTVHLKSCEVVIDGTNNGSLSMPAAYVTGGATQWSHPQSGMVVVAGGPCIIESCILDATQAGSSPSTVTCVLTGNATATGFASLEVKGCLVASTTGQVQVYDSSGNKLTNAFTSQRYNIRLFGNKGGPSYGILPNYEGQPATQGALGSYYLSQGGNQPTPTYHGEIRGGVWDAFPVAFSNASIAVASTTATLTLTQLKANTIVTKVAVIVGTAFTSGAVSQCHVQVGNNGGAIDQYILSYDVLTPASNPAGMSDSDMGVGLARATAVQGGDWSQFKSSSSLVQIKFTAVGANLNALTAGALTVYLETAQIGYP